MLICHIIAIKMLQLFPKNNTKTRTPSNICLNLKSRNGTTELTTIFFQQSLQLYAVVTVSGGELNL